MSDIVLSPTPISPITPPKPVNLYILLDNSTSMQGSDPSGVTRLEAANRLIFYYAIQPAFNNAGYVFFKNGQYGFNGNIQLTTSQFLSQEIQSWSLVDNPFDSFPTQKVTVHTVTYSYLVTHSKTVFTSSNSSAGITLASQVLSTTTPDVLYGSSTSADWINRGLPAPNSLDAFTAPGTPGNRYSGTEMLGALISLTNLLNKECNDPAFNPNTLTYVFMATDGRPERRPWWDNRPQYGESFPSGPGGWRGVNVAIPTDADLSGNPVRSSGLRYTSAGQPIKVPDYYAGGNDIWTQNQKELNKALDTTAFKSNPGNVNVFTIGMGDGGISNWNLIYSDLFTNKTFQTPPVSAHRSNRNWNYRTYTTF